MLVKCDHCGKKFAKKLKYAIEHDHHFCCREHYHQFRREHLELISHPIKNQDLSCQEKLKKWAELRRNRQNVIL